MSETTATMRERWYALHRARRALRRDDEKRAREILALPNARPVDKFRAAQRLINPLFIVDYSMPNGGISIYRADRKLP